MDIARLSTGNTAGHIGEAVRTAAGGNPTHGAGQQLGYDAFLQLLIAQMQHQDPLEPMNSSDYVAQLATFSQVEKSVELNERVAALLSASLLEQAGAVIGRTLTSADGSVHGLVQSSRIVGNEVVAVLADGRELKLDRTVKLGGGAA